MIARLCWLALMLLHVPPALALVRRGFDVGLSAPLDVALGYEQRRDTYRIGAGDAFAAGVLHGLHTGRDDATALQLGLAAACLKHATPGDFSLASAADLEAFLGERRFDVRR